ncbi:S1 family peptidase [Agrobacterium vitis]
MHQRHRLISLLTAMVFWISPAGAAEVNFASTSSNTVLATVSDGQANTRSGSGALVAEASGQTESMCTAYGRLSSSQASANVVYSEQTDGGVAMQLSATAFAAGGHYRTCGLCGPNHQCVIIQGHDTSASGEATALSTTKIEFGSELNHSRYLVSVAASGATERLSVRLKKPNGEYLAIDPQKSTSTVVEPTERDVYFLEIATKAEASDKGGCCDSRLQTASQVKLTVVPAPIISSEANLQPFIIGGTPVEGKLYDSVVGILIDGKIHCSGTVVGAKTVLTAAHCVAGYEPAVAEGRVQIFLGNSVFEPGKTKRVTASSFPKGEDGIRYRRTPSSIEHDVGLFYTSEPLEVPAASLHHDKPSWSKIKNDYHSELTFVGFGLKIIKGGEGSGAGVKREATWRYSQLDQWIFLFNGQKSNTCSGDSGGPAFTRDQDTGELTLVGTTSAGNGDCTFGMEMRVDAHLPWIVSRIQ